jgi:hypothetical protein
MVERVDDGGEGVEVLAARVCVRRLGVHADMDVGGYGRQCEEEQGEKQKTRHGN